MRGAGGGKCPPPPESTLHSHQKKERTQHKYEERRDVSFLGFVFVPFAPRRGNVSDVLNGSWEKGKRAKNSQKEKSCEPNRNLLTLGTSARTSVVAAVSAATGRAFLSRSSSLRGRIRPASTTTTTTAAAAAFLLCHSPASVAAAGAVASVATARPATSATAWRKFYEAAVVVMRCAASTTSTATSRLGVSGHLSHGGLKGNLRGGRRTGSRRLWGGGGGLGRVCHGEPLLPETLRELNAIRRSEALPHNMLENIDHRGGVQELLRRAGGGGGRTGGRLWGGVMLLELRRCLAWRGGVLANRRA